MIIRKMKEDTAWPVWNWAVGQPEGQDEGHPCPSCVPHCPRYMPPPEQRSSRREYRETSVWLSLTGDAVFLPDNSRFTRRAGLTKAKYESGLEALKKKCPYNTAVLPVCRQYLA
ncbi:hypothetical protein ElyMa_005395600 [Elysia marginata]|uniref:Uncharacterized protein n=1 Tax=Elysia marginata TaxID=1093978 RepID=A0AAV4EHV1_9GAST|nr:hypothetical protein ElyMa_005395600 [Elysia marginata]